MKVIEFFVESFILPHELILDFDATDGLTYGMQEKRFFHGYYDYYLFSSALGVLWRSITLRISPALKDGCSQTFPDNSFPVGETTPQEMTEGQSHFPG